MLGTGRYARLGASETTYSLSMPVELGGKRAARTRVAQADQSVAAFGTTAAKADLTLKVTQAFIATAASARRASLADRRRELSEQAERAARLRVDAGKVSPMDAQRASAQRLRAQVDSARAERALSVNQAALARLIGAPPPIAINAPWFDRTEDQMALQAEGNGLAQAMAAAQVGAATARVDMARRNRVPDLIISAGARRLRETNDTAAVFTLSIPLPLFNNGGADVARAQADLEKAESERTAAAMDFDQALAAAQAEVADAKALADSAGGPELTAAREAARIARIGYAEGKFSQLDLIEAERSLSQTEDAAIDALASFHDARARLARLLGQLTPIYKD